LSTHARIESSFLDRPEPLRELPGVAFPAATPSALRIKRVWDCVLTLLAAPLALLLAAPILVLVMLDGAPPLYRHLRIGRGGRPFFCYKIRTMAPGAEDQLPALMEDAGARGEWDEGFKLKHDPRVTRLGGFLRRTSLDELPQLWNVLKGEMSLVGPRPIVADELERYGDCAPAYLACQPGISGLWQVSGRNDVGYAQRVALDFYYASNWSMALDLRILLRTLPVVLKADGSY
jgi:lipopolysaccharide/colanic/teichoic acid biosynthesis glycosyltransferase